MSSNTAGSRMQKALLLFNVYLIKWSNHFENDDILCPVVIHGFSEIFNYKVKAKNGWHVRLR